MKTYFLTFLLVCSLASFPVLAQEDETTPSSASLATVVYLSELGDIPLMPGLEQVEDSALMFDKPAGRIVEAYFTTDESHEDILAFYATSLPPLGWRMTGPDSFERHEESLTIAFEENESMSPLVLFRLEPAETAFKEEKETKKPDNTAP